MGGASTVSFQVKLSLEGLVDRLDPLAAPRTPVTTLRFDPVTAAGDLRVDAIRVLRPPPGS